MVMYEEECEVSLLDNLFNSLFYLLNPFPQGEQLTSCSDDLAQLANTEFSNPMLIYFVLGDNIPISHTINPNQPVYDIQ